MIRIGIAGLIGYEAALKLYAEHREELNERFSGRFIKAFLELNKLNHKKEELSWARVSKEAEENGLMNVLASEPYYIAEIEQGGLWAALWKACEDLKIIGLKGFRNDYGLESNLKDIIIKQEIIEICELYDEDPYEASSKGAFILAWDDDLYDSMGDEARKLINSASVIGHVNKNKKRVLVDGDKERFMTPPSRQEKDINDRKKRK